MSAKFVESMKNYTKMPPNLILFKIGIYATCMLVSVSFKTFSFSFSLLKDIDSSYILVFISKEKNWLSTNSARKFRFRVCLVPTNTRESTREIK